MDGLLFAPGVIGLAGHVDHGKSALVHALTGTDPDRLKVEKERGMTTDLGFASLLLPDGRRVGIIDVPGHEKFIRHMIAGAAAIKAVVLAVACDDGVMPQTVEHLAIAGLLGVADGCVALTKADLADGDLLDLAAGEVSALVRGTFLDGKPVVPVSSRTRAGLSDLDSVIGEMASRFASADFGQKEFRMPVLRSFRIEGHGLVLTGVPISGCVARGDELEAQGLRLRVKRLQSYGEEIERSEGPSSLALNVAIAGKGTVERGDVLCAPGLLRPVERFQARFDVLPAAPRDLAGNTKVQVFHGAIRVPATMTLIGCGKAGPGESVFADFRLERPLFACAGDRFVVRSPSPPATLGGGTILSTPRQGAPRKAAADQLIAVEKALKDAAEFVELLVGSAGRDGADMDFLRRATLRTRHAMESAIGDLESRGGMVRTSRDGLFLSRDALLGMRKELLEWLRKRMALNPLEAAVTVSEAESELGWDKRVLDFVAEGLCSAGMLCLEGGSLRLPAAGRGQEEDSGPRAQAVLRFLAGRGLEPAEQGAIASAPGSGAEGLDGILGTLLRRRMIAAVAKDRFVHSDALARARTVLEELLRSRGGVAGAAAAKQALAVSNSTATMYLEFFEKEGLIARAGKLFRLARARQA